MEYDFQRASLLKRAPAWLLDFILLITVAVGLMAAAGSVLNADAHNKAMDDLYARYEQEYQISFALTEEEFMQLEAAERERYDAAAEALSQDAEAQKTFEAMLNVTLATMGIGFLGAFLILEFLIPLWLKNGQTIGKKCFGVALMRKDGVKVTSFMMFARSLLGKYTIETMIPLLLLNAVLFNILGMGGLLLCVGVLLAQIIITVATRNKTAIHDLMACTVAVDLASQMIFDSPEAMAQYHEKIHVDKAVEEQE